jgi:hypothetical protein
MNGNIKHQRNIAVQIAGIIENCTKVVTRTAKRRKKKSSMGGANLQTMTVNVSVS